MLFAVDRGVTGILVVVTALGRPTWVGRWWAVVLVVVVGVLMSISAVGTATAASLSWDQLKRRDGQNRVRVWMNNKGGLEGMWPIE